MNIKKVFVKCILICLVSILVLTGCSNKENENGINEKIISELSYIEESVFTITNKYAKGEYLTEEKINWEDIIDDEKKINKTIDTIILDLSEESINAEDIISLNNEFNNLLETTIIKDEPNLLISLSDLYMVIPKMLTQISDNKTSVMDKELKSLVLKTFSFVNTGNWEEARNSIQTAFDKYSEMEKNVDYIQEKSYKLNKTYVLLGEIRNSIEKENLELFKIKFVNFIEKI